MTFIEQGDIVWIDFDPSVGHEPAKRRPAVVMSVGLYNNVLSSLVVVCPITSTPSSHPLHIPVPLGHTVSGWICIEQVTALDPVARYLRQTDDAMDLQTMGLALETLASIFDV